MATTTEDPRIQKIEETKTYVLLHKGVEPLYVGSTARPLDRRLSEHKKEADRRDTKLYNRLEEINLDDVSIHPLPLLSEKEALEHLSEVTLNSYETPEAEYEGPDWTPEMVDVLEDANSSTEAADRLGIPYHHADDARRKLGLGESSRDLPPGLVRGAWTLFHLLEGATYASVAESVSESWGRDVSLHQVGSIIREEHYADVDKPSKVAIEAKKAYQSKE